MQHMHYCESTRVDIDIVVCACMVQTLIHTAYAVLQNHTHTIQTNPSAQSVGTVLTYFGSANATPSAQSAGTVLLLPIARILDVPVL